MFLWRLLTIPGARMPLEYDKQAIPPTGTSGGGTVAMTSIKIAMVASTGQSFTGESNVFSMFSIV